MLVQLNIRCLICINRQHPKHCIEFDNDAGVLLNFHSKYNNTTLFIFIHHRVMVETYDNKNLTKHSKKRKKLNITLQRNNKSLESTF